MSVITNLTERPLQIFTKVASGVVQNRHFVKFDGSQCSVRGEIAQGIAREYADDGKTFPVIVGGSALVVAGEALADEVEVTTNASGHAVKAYTGEHIIGKTLVAQAVSGQLVPIQLYSDTQRHSAIDEPTTTTAAEEETTTT